MPFISFNRIQHIYFPFHAWRSHTHFHANTNTNTYQVLCVVCSLMAFAIELDSFYEHGYWIHTIYMTFAALRTAEIVVSLNVYNV